FRSIPDLHLAYKLEQCQIDVPEPGESKDPEHRNEIGRQPPEPVGQVVGLTRVARRMDARVGRERMNPAPGVEIDQAQNQLVDSEEEAHYRNRLTRPQRQSLRRE